MTTGKQTKVIHISFLSIPFTDHCQPSSVKHLSFPHSRRKCWMFSYRDHSVIQPLDLFGHNCSDRILQDSTTPSTPNWKLVIKAETHNCTRKRKKNKQNHQTSRSYKVNQTVNEKKKEKEKIHSFYFNLASHYENLFYNVNNNIRFRLYHQWISANTQHQCLQSLLIADILMLRVFKIIWLTTERETFSLKFTHLYSSVCDRILGITSFSLTTPLLLLCVKISTFLFY